MKPYPRNNISVLTSTPQYIQNNTQYKNSRYSTYKIIDNLPYKALEIKLTNSISKNSTFVGYYYTTVKNETLYTIAKKYYDDESLYWIIAKANGLKNEGVTIVKKDITIIVPSYLELQKTGGYFGN